MSTWTQERIETIKRLWAEGLSGSQIAERLGPEVNRNMVIAKLDRLGMIGDRRKPRQSRLRGLVGKTRRPQTTAEKAQARQEFMGFSTPIRRLPKWMREAIADGELARIEALSAADTARVSSLQDLEDKHCRFPVGDPKASTFRGFCGADRIEGLSYCEAHAERCHSSPSVRSPEQILAHAAILAKTEPHFGGPEHIQVKETA